jgi:F-type H+-transporting ATPase subunit gamma
LAGSIELSKTTALREQIASLNDLRAVMKAMQNLALAEVGKLARQQRAGEALYDGLVESASQLAYFHPHLFQRPDAATDLFIIVGSERGFCGDFNDRILRHWREKSRAQMASQASAIVVGAKLADKISSGGRIISQIVGATTSDEIADVVEHIVDAISKYEHRCGSLPLNVSAFSVTRSGESEQPILPFSPLKVRSRAQIPPELTIPLDAFVREFIDDYVEAALHNILTTSLMMENRERADRMNIATRRLDERSARLIRELNRERQRGITQEIETILLSAGSYDL